MWALLRPLRNGNVPDGQWNMPLVPHNLDRGMHCLPCAGNTSVSSAPQPSFLLQYGLFCVLTYKSTPIGFLTAAKVRNKRDFHQLKSTKNKMHSRRFCSQKKKTGCIIGRLRQIGWSVWRSHFFSSLSLTLL